LSLEAAELRQDLVIEGHLITADRTPIGRIESQNDWVTAKVAQRHRVIWRTV
jgi:hypothetical protein